MRPAVGDQALLASRAGGFVADREHGGQVEHMARVDANSTDAATPAPKPAINAFFPPPRDLLSSGFYVGKGALWTQSLTTLDWP